MDEGVEMGAVEGDGEMPTQGDNDLQMWEGLSVEGKETPLLPPTPRLPDVCAQNCNPVPSRDLTG